MLLTETSQKSPTAPTDAWTVPATSPHRPGTVNPRCALPHTGSATLMIAFAALPPQGPWRRCMEEIVLRFHAWVGKPHRNRNRRNGEDVAPSKIALPNLIVKPVHPAIAISLCPFSPSEKSDESRLSPAPSSLSAVLPGPARAGKDSFLHNPSRMGDMGRPASSVQRSTPAARHSSAIRPSKINDPRPCTIQYLPTASPKERPAS